MLTFTFYISFVNINLRLRSGESIKNYLMVKTTLQKCNMFLREITTT